MAEKSYEKIECMGKKWFLKFPYKVIKTTATFFDDEVELKQGSGFALVNDSNMYSTKIKYSSIEAVGTETKYSTPNIVAAVGIAIIAILAGIAGIASLGGMIGVAVIVIPLMLFMGRTAQTNVQYNENGQSYLYEIPFEFKSDADSVAEVINSRR